MRIPEGYELRAKLLKLVMQFEAVENNALALDITVWSFLAAGVCGAFGSPMPTEELPEQSI